MTGHSPRRRIPTLRLILSGVIATSFAIGGALAQSYAPITPEGLSSADRAIIEQTPQDVRRTLQAMVAEGYQPNELDRTLLSALSRADSSARDYQPGSLVLGQRRCTVWWYGAGEDASRRRVASDRCEVYYGDSGETVVRNLTGDRFNVGFIPLEDGNWAYAGRSFLPRDLERAYDADMPDNLGDAAYGNISGRALISDRRLILVTGEVRGLESDESVFQVVDIPDR